MQPSTRTRLVRTAWLAAAAAVLTAVFTLYGQPAFLVTLANQVWACF